MTGIGTTRTVVLSSLVLLALGTWTPCPAEFVWFDETAGARGYVGFETLAASYADFMGEPSGVITFDDLDSGAVLSNQYAESFGVTFANTANGRRGFWSGVHPEGGSLVEHLTGYDGSYMPDGDPVFTKLDNHLPDTPLTIFFDEPVAGVGAFVGMGVQGDVHSLSVAVYDEDDKLLGQKTVASWLWEGDSSRQNYESFFALRADEATISRVEILNDSPRDFAGNTSS